MPPTSENNEHAPEAGARFLLERDGAGDGASASYRAAIFTPDATYEGRAMLDEGGGVVLEGLGAGAPAKLVERLEMFARLTARGAAKRRDDGMPPWPARVLRWRPDE